MFSTSRKRAQAPRRDKERIPFFPLADIEANLFLIRSGGASSEWYFRCANGAIMESLSCIDASHVSSDVKVRMRILLSNVYDSLRRFARGECSLDPAIVDYDRLADYARNNLIILAKVDRVNVDKLVVTYP